MCVSARQSRWAVPGRRTCAERRAHAAALEVTGAGVQQEADSQRTFASALVAAAAAAGGDAAPSRASGRAAGGSLRRPGPGEVRNQPVTPGAAAGSWPLPKRSGIALRRASHGLLRCTVRGS